MVSPTSPNPDVGRASHKQNVRSPGVFRSTSQPYTVETTRTVKAWREQWRQLGLQAWSAESDARREVQNPRVLNQEQLEEIGAVLSKADGDFDTWQGELWSGLGKVRKRIQVLAGNIHFAPKQDDIRRMVQSAEHDLRVFGEQTRQQEEELIALECSLQDTLEASLVRFEGWCAQESCLQRVASHASQPNRASPCRQTKKDHKLSKNDGRQLDSMHEQLDKLIAAISSDGGPTGRWTDEDHDTFLRVLQKFKRKTGIQFLAEVQDLLPHKKHEDLIEHVRWLNTYEDRTSEKRQLIEKWRCLKAIAQTPETPVHTKKELAAEAASEEKRHRAASQERIQKERNDARQKVAEWRNARSEEQRLQHEEEQRRERENKERECRERRRQIEQKRQAIEASKQQRSAEEALLSISVRPGSQTPTGRAISLEDRKRIAERNAAHLQKRASLLQNKRSEAKADMFDPPVRIGSVASPAYRHIESRLEDSTKAYVDRSRDLVEDSVSIQQGSKYGVVPGNFAHQGVVRTLRSSPSWRSGFGV
mmetsp:Transcript_6991/g.11440  ORF Transcript_6991/g.11440 Transcript_6991/m.11440 type:complete len:534 (+) Transcript_6991:112-1713(+)